MIIGKSFDLWPFLLEAWELFSFSFDFWITERDGEKQSDRELGEGIEKGKERQYKRDQEVSFVLNSPLSCNFLLLVTPLALSAVANFMVFGIISCESLIDS